MINWISKLLGGGSKGIPENVDSGWAKRIEEFLTPLDNLPKGKGRNGLACDIFSYVLQGEPVSVLNEVSADRAIGERLKVLGFNQFSSLAGLYAGFPSLPPEICLRWALLLEAATRSAPHCQFWFQSGGNLSWAEVLIVHASGCRQYCWPREEPKFRGLTMECVERMLAEDGQPPEALIVSAFATPIASRYGAESRLQMVSFFDDFPKALERHAEKLRPLILPSQHQQKLHVLKLLDRAPGDVLALFAPELCQLGVSSSKQVRAAATPLINRCGSASIDPLKETALRDKPEQRVHALRLLWSLAGKISDNQLRTFAKGTVEADKAPSVQALIGEWKASNQTIDFSVQQYDYTIPSIDLTGELTSDVSGILKKWGVTTFNGNSLTMQTTEKLNALFHSTGHPTLLELQVILASLGYPASLVLNAYCNAYTPLATDWDTAAVWPFFAHNQEMLVRELSTTKSDNYFFDRKKLFRAIATMPTLPVQVVTTLYGLALGSGKTDRPLAQGALGNLPEKETRIIGALGDGKADTRTFAAQWLGRLRHAPAIPALEQAVLKEKHDVAKGAMLDALQLLGRPVEKYLDRDALAKEAARCLAKGLPKDLEWFPWTLLPDVRWADAGEPVPDTVLRWMLIQAVKQKSPEPNAVLRKYCSLFHPRDREAFGQFILESWLHQDVVPISADEAEKRASAQARSIHAGMRQYPQYYQNDPHFNCTVEELKALYLPMFLRQPAGSAIGTKGLLAVAGACAAERASTPVARYLKEYYGTRAAQGRALIAMLAWIEHPSATQLMLSIGSRFRTKSFQEEATRQAEALAERKGWTLAELSDRTIPSAGFDECGELELNYGQRVFTAKLTPDFKVELFSPEGKTISALPEPRSSDDAELAKDARKAFSASKKEIKTIVAMQTDRFYEALCTERDWSFEDWNLYLNQHPVVRRLVQRLVWVHEEEGRILASFRPLEDGSLTDWDDNEISLPNDARIRIAHDSLLASDDVARWQQHLVDYEISPLFQQLGKGIYALPEEKAKTDSIRDFEGHLIESFALRGRSLKLGYTRGAAGDGGWFTEYEKRFPTLGLVAMIEFTGSPLPEENRTVALLGLTFTSSGGDSWQRSGIALSKVPRILLSECYNDLRLIAAEGRGFDPDWQKKSDY